MPDILVRGGQWIVVGWVTLVLVVQLYTVFRSQTRVRFVCLITALGNLMLSVANALRSELDDPLADGRINSKIYILFFHIATVVFFDLIIGMLLDLGRNFYPHTRSLVGSGRSLALFWTIGITAAVFSVFCLANGVYFVYAGFTDIYHAVFCLNFSIAILSGCCATAYAFAPLIWTSKIVQHCSNSLPFAVGIWYYAGSTILLVAYSGFYIKVLTTSTSFFAEPFIQCWDLAFRTIFILLYSSPPPQKAIRVIASKVFNDQLQSPVAATAPTPTTKGTADTPRSTIRYHLRTPSALDEIDVDVELAYCEEDPAADSCGNAAGNEPLVRN